MGAWLAYLMEKDMTDINTRSRVRAPHPIALTAAMLPGRYRCLMTVVRTVNT